MSHVERHCTVLFNTEKVSSSVTQDDIIADLESNDVAKKIKAIKHAIMLILSGENMSRVLMTVIRYCINAEDHQLKKLMMLYWEVVPKYDAAGALLPQMILVCNALRNDLNHPNEYIRASMLRFLCKLKEPELLEPLVPSVKACLEHRHSLVRRTAAITLYTIHKFFGEQLLPDGPEVMSKFIESEADSSSRTNAFLFLCNQAEDHAIEFLGPRMEEVQKFGDGFAMHILSLTRKVCRRDPAQKSRFVRCLFQMLQSASPAVSYESAWTLVSLSSAPTATRAAASTYAGLLNSQSDNNVKLIVLARLNELKKGHTKVLQEVLMDVLRALSSPNIDICRQVLELAMDLISPRNVEEVVQILKKEIIRTQTLASNASASDASSSTNGGGGSGGGGGGTAVGGGLGSVPVFAGSKCGPSGLAVGGMGGGPGLGGGGGSGLTGSGSGTGEDDGSAYRHLLITSIHRAANKFANVADSVVHLLMDFLSSSDSAGAYDVIVFVRSIVEQYPELRNSVLEKLLILLPDIKSPDVVAVGLWIVGEYSLDPLQVSRSFEEILAAVGDLPFDQVLAAPKTKDATAAAAAAEGSDEGGAAPSPIYKTNTKVLSDGTYATQTTVSEIVDASGASGKGGAGSSLDPSSLSSGLRRSLRAGDVFLGSVLAGSMTKLVLRAIDYTSEGNTEIQIGDMQLRALMLLCNIARMMERRSKWAYPQPGNAGSGGSSASSFGHGIHSSSALSINIVHGKIVGSGLNNDDRGSVIPSYGGAYADCKERVTLCCRLLLDPVARDALKDTWLVACKDAYTDLLLRRQEQLQLQKLEQEAEKKRGATTLMGRKSNNKAKPLPASAAAAAAAAAAGAEGVLPVQVVSDRMFPCTPDRCQSQADDLIVFRQLRPRAALGADIDLYDGNDLSRATGTGEADRDENKLKHVYQLSGMGDPVYAEAIVTVHDYDIVLEMHVMNRTPNTLTNLTVELSTMGDLKLVERPQSYTIGPLDSTKIMANIKVSSTETGHIFGTIAYENAQTLERAYVNLNDIHLDIIDYINPATCSDEAFRSMWAEFEWENKVAINTPMTEIGGFLDHIVSSTSMKCLTPTSMLGGKSSFLAANLYARSVFGEDALVNVSVEKKEDGDGKLCGYIRIRSKTQGIALSLGDRITLVQRAKNVTPGGTTTTAGSAGASANPALPASPSTGA